MELILSLIVIIIVAAYPLYRFGKLKIDNDRIYREALNKWHYCDDCISCKSELCRNVKSIHHKKNVSKKLVCGLYVEKPVRYTYKK